MDYAVLLFISLIINNRRMIHDFTNGRLAKIHGYVAIRDLLNKKAPENG